MNDPTAELDWETAGRREGGREFEAAWNLPTVRMNTPESIKKKHPKDDHTDITLCRSITMFYGTDNILWNILHIQPKWWSTTVQQLLRQPTHLGVEMKWIYFHPHPRLKDSRSEGGSEFEAARNLPTVRMNTPESNEHEASKRWLHGHHIMQIHNDVLWDWWYFVEYRLRSNNSLDNPPILVWR